jgi:hypothetical protein
MSAPPPSLYGQGQLYLFFCLYHCLSDLCNWCLYIWLRRFKSSYVWRRIDWYVVTFHRSLLHPYSGSKKSLFPLLVLWRWGNKLISNTGKNGLCNVILKEIWLINTSVRTSNLTWFCLLPFMLTVSLFQKDLGSRFLILCCVQVKICEYILCIVCVCF